MSRGSGLSTISVGIFFAILIIILPVSAYSVAIYGTGTGFNPDLHNDSVVVVQSVPGSAGAELDSNISRFVQPSVDVILLGGVDTFAPSTAEKIEAAVAEGKILVVTYPGNRLFNTSLPAYNNGTVTGGQFLELSNPNDTGFKEIFTGLQTQFPLQGVTPEGEQVVVRNSSVTVLNYDTGMPALLYGKYGKGYVIEWTTTPVPSYMSRETADTILNRLIIRLLPAPAPLPTTSVTPQNTTVVTTRLETSTTTGIPVHSETPAQTTGNVTVFSSPIGASILIDGIYYGTTPANLTGIPQGNHIIRLTQSGFFDYEGSIYVIPDQTSHAFGTLPPLNQIQAAATPLSIIVPVVTAESTPAKGLFDNTSIIVAIIGVFTATIAAGATIFSHVMKAKKE